jgi:hypothetical protein
MIVKRLQEAAITLTLYGPDDRFSIGCSYNFCFLLHRVHTDSGALLASCSVGTDGSFPGVKSLPFTVKVKNALRLP